METFWGNGRYLSAVPQQVSFPSAGKVPSPRGGWGRAKRVPAKPG
ncbi:MAG TPA: hypothetical protein VGK19_23355 [Capsulimonadaceae bacterium]